MGKITVNLNKDVFHQLNKTAQIDFEKAKAMLDGINLVLGTNYDWLNKRVIFSDDNTTVAMKYATAHDAWANAEE